MNPAILWQPSAASMQQSQLFLFIEHVNLRYDLGLKSYAALYQWSIDDPVNFWNALSEFCGVLFVEPPEIILQDEEDFQQARWFIGAKLNFAQNLLQRCDDYPAIIAINEFNQEQKISYRELNQRVAKLADYFRSLGIEPGDRVVAVLPNIPEAVIGMLATTSLGAIWSSCSPDFGLPGLIDRFGQINPKILIAATAHSYKGQTFTHAEKIVQLQQALPSLVKTITVAYLKTNAEVPNSIEWSTCLKDRHDQLKFDAFDFDHPVYILYSSGTTGKPKCMVHGAGGTLLQHLKELKLHTNLQPEDVMFFNTTCGWMMWNWMVSSLSVGATIVLYEGAPFYPNNDRLFQLIDRYKINVFGVGAKFLEMSEKLAIIPKDLFKLTSLKTILTTGSPLLPESFDYVYRAIKTNVQLSSISGGSDIISCFALGNPLLPVFRGELQCRGLGMAVEIYDDTGSSRINEKGELVCTKPFPSQPIYFWNDPTGEKYYRAYFAKFPGVWTHGDYALINDHGGVVIYGRSDTTLNPNGIRVGTAEIYQALEPVSELLESLAVGQMVNGTERILLFVILRSKETLDESLKKKIQTIIRDNLSPHHVPAKIIAVPDLPRTKNGKLMEIAVKKIIHGEPIDNAEALLNPECLNYFKNLTSS